MDCTRPDCVFCSSYCELDEDTTWAFLRGWEAAHWSSSDESRWVQIDALYVGGV